MTNLKTFVGIDVSKSFFDVCVAEPGKARCRQFCYDTAGLEALCSYLPQACVCVMEATGPYYLRLAMYLHQRGFGVSVVNPLVIKRFAQMRLRRTKTDKADSQLIAAYGASEQPPLWQPPAPHQVKLRQMQALLEQFHKQRSALLCQSEAFEASGMAEREIQELVQKMLVHLDEQIAHLHHRMEALIGAHHPQMLKNMTTIPGLGKKTAIALILVSGGFARFDNYKQLLAYVRLSPRRYRSGTSIKGREGICKMGMSRIRAMLYVCAWSAKKCNQACRQLYERLVEKGKAKRLALIAVAAKLLKQAFAIALNNQPYQINYTKNICF
ncbi:MAG: IS110 family transposase [Chitinophagaceae bacterium]